MKKSKLIVLPIICILAVIFLYNRVQSGKEIVITKEEAQEVNSINATENVENVEFPTTYKKEVSDTLCFDAEVVVPESVDVNGLYWGTAISAPLEKDKIYQHLFGSSTDVKREYNTEDDLAVNRQGKECRWETAEDENGRYMLLEENSYLYFTDEPEYSYIDNCIQSDRRGSADNLEVYSAMDNLDFMTREEAKKKIEQALLEMGIETR